MKRYNIFQDEYNGPGVVSEEAPDGEWVKYEDVRRCFGGKVECNCEEMSKLFFSWICRAHGYKRA